MNTLQLREFGLSQTIEVFVDTKNVTRFRFGDNLTNLDNALVHAISIGDSAISKTPTGKSVLSNASLYNSYITLMGSKNEQYNYLLPFILILRFTYCFLKPKLINFRNSYVEIPDVDALVLPPENYGILFTVFYEKYDPAKHKLDSSGELIETED